MSDTAGVGDRGEATQALPNLPRGKGREGEGGKERGDRETERENKGNGIRFKDRRFHRVSFLPPPKVWNEAYHTSSPPPPMLRRRRLRRLSSPLTKTSSSK